jgi:protease IV
MTFLREVLSSALGFFVAIALLFIIFWAAIIGAASAGSNKITTVDDNSVLRISFEAPVAERGSDHPQSFSFGPFGEETGLGLDHIIADLAKAKNDDRIKGILLDMSGISAAPSTIFDIHEALVDFKESGKWIVNYSEGISQGGYYLASVADEIYLYPQGDLDFRGLSAEMMYFKGLLDKLGVEVQVLRGPNNKYKSAVEPFMNSEMSASDREQTEALIGGIWNIMLEGISAQRDISVDDLNRMCNNLEVRVAQDAVDLGLVDGLKYSDEIETLIQEKLGISDDAETEDKDGKKKSKIAYVDLEDYHHAKVEGSKSDSKWDSDRIAVVFAVGAIESGEGDDTTIGSERIAEALRDARLDDKVKAVVLRVNSPGGSALASDVIWRETELIKAAGKPFVVSMGDLAASGGYYIACSADRILANRNTITGSIGVFGMLPNLEGFYNEKLGVTFSRVNTNEHADIYSTNKGLDTLQLTAINESVAQIYTQFTGIVAAGRGMTVEEVEAVAGGRVWTGEDALSRGLVDEIGNLDSAIVRAAGLAGLDNYKIKSLPEMIDPFQEMMKELTGETAVKALQKDLGIEADVLHNMMELDRILKSGDIQARLPYFLEIR